MIFLSFMLLLFLCKKNTDETVLSFLTK